MASSKVNKYDAAALLRAQKEIAGDILFDTGSIPIPNLSALQKSSLDKFETHDASAHTSRKTESAPVKKQINQPAAAPEAKAKEAPAAKVEFPIASADSLSALHELIGGCLNCPLGAARKNFVFGEGKADAHIMVIGEGPGADEDELGRPFVGRAGKLLNDILSAIKLAREEVFIGNIVKCRPPKNRVPLPEEISECLPFLERQIALISPKFILCLGSTAAGVLLKSKETLGKQRQNTHSFHGIPVIVTYHPAALLRNPQWKRDCWEDVKKLRRMYDDFLGIPHLFPA